MTTVSPVPSDVQLGLLPARKSVRVFRALGRWVRRVVGRLPGGYSIAKLDTFDRFRAETTTPWLLSVLLLTPVPCFALNFIIESIPLADPATGFHKSLHFQIRNYLTAVTMTAMPVFMKINYLPDLSTVTWRFVLAYGLITATVAIGINAAIAVVARVFPVPFTQFAPAGPMALVGLLLNRLLPQNPETKQRVDKINMWLGMDMLPVVVYPMFTAVFMSLKPTQQVWLSLLLPVTKRLLRHVFWLMFSQDPDIAGAVTCSVGHLYHVLFTAMCLQNAKSLETLVAIVAVSVIQMLMNCHDILKDGEKLQRVKAELRAFEVVVTDDIISTALDLTQQGALPKLLHRKSPSRMFSNYPGFQGTDFVKRHQRLLQSEPSLTRIPVDSHYTGQDLRRSSRYRDLLSAKLLLQRAASSIGQGLAQIFPLAGEPIGENGSDSRARTTHSFRLRTDQRADHTRKRELYVRCVAFTLHQTEITLLRSYITIFMLIFYGNYLTLVYRLPNRKFFFTMYTMTTSAEVDNMVFHILLLCSVEAAFLAIYLVLISRRLGIPGVRQLGFVLWSQRVLLQSKVLALSIMILGFPLEHYGNGIIFKLRTVW